MDSEAKPDQNEAKDVSRKSRNLFRDPRKNRVKSRATYEPPVTDREWWWRRYITDAPKPGSYEVESFLDELGKRNFTYLLKTQGRKRCLDFRDGRLLLPGAYNFEGDVERLERSRNSYSFRNTDRNARVLMNYQDKDHHLGPGQYASEKYDGINVPKMAVTHYSMKSQANRFRYVTQTQGPDVVGYDTKGRLNEHPPYCSCFLSKSPRFRPCHSKVPGPGTYAHSFEPIHSWNSNYRDYYV